MVKDHLDSEIKTCSHHFFTFFFQISSKGSFIYTIPQTAARSLRICPTPPDVQAGPTDGDSNSNLFRQAKLLGEMDSAMIHWLLKIVLGEDYPRFMDNYEWKGCHLPLFWSQELTGSVWSPLDRPPSRPSPPLGANGGT